VIEQNLACNMFSWEHFRIYLSGAIDFDRNNASAWRDEWTNRLEAIGIKKEQIFNPCKKPLPQNTSCFMDNEAEVMHSHRVKQDWVGLCEVMSQIAHIDLRMLDKSDLVLVNMPQYFRCDELKEIIDVFDSGIKIFYELKQKISRSRVRNLKHNTYYIASLKGYY
jgi:hypothetical protein